MIKQPIRKAKGSDPYPSTLTFRTGQDNRKALIDELNREKKKRNFSSMANTIETVLLEHYKII